MKESTLLKIALMTTVIGILLLFYTGLQPIPESSSKEVQSKTEGAVKITGEVSKITKTGSTVFLTVELPLETTVVVFDNDINLEEGSRIEVIGNIDEYQGKKEVIANRIRVVAG